MPPKTILITGYGPSGISSALATEFQLRGHRVIASGLNSTLLSSFHSNLGLDTVPMDVTSSSSIASGVASVSKLTHGRIDMLINNAGIVHIMLFADMSLDDARRVFEVNVLGVFAVTQAFLPLLVASSQYQKQQSGKSNAQAVVANLGSVNAVFAPLFLAVYNASKAAVEVLGTTLRRELAPLGIRVVTMKTGACGVISSPMQGSRFCRREVTTSRYGAGLKGGRCWRAGGLSMRMCMRRRW